MNNQPTPRQVADAIEASQMLARLANCSRSGDLYLNSEMRAGMVKVEFRPDFKQVMQEVAYTCRTTMADFIKDATRERVERILNERIAAGEAK